ncbi:MAG: protein kinase [Alphaproteobacteria bacterium]|nr:protein kinase [Alphaproteobacteria bacterium]
MTTATLPMVWKGRSGREYVPAPGRTRLRYGELATVRKVVGRGAVVGTSEADEGIPVALKLWREGDETSLDRLQQEARILVELASRGAEIPSPRLYDLVGDPLVTGVVMEWCPVDVERWWRDKLREPDALGRLFAALADAATRLDEYHEFRKGSSGLDAAHGDVKPTNILLSAHGRWLVSGFGAPPFAPPDDEVWADSQMVVATENFVAPEVLFSARVQYPGSVDCWSLGATLFALLKLKRMVDDGAPLPFNGTASPRFRMERVGKVFEVFGRDPRRFVDRDLDAQAFPDPLVLPEEDRRTVRDAVRGLFGASEDALAREEELYEELVGLLDRAMSIDPAHRFTNLRDLAAAFQTLTRNYLAISALVVQGPLSAASPDQLARELAVSQRRAGQLAARVSELEAEIVRLRSATPTPSRSGVPTWASQLGWVGVALGAMFLLQALTLGITLVLTILIWSMS